MQPQMNQKEMANVCIDIDIEHKNAVTVSAWD